MSMTLKRLAPSLGTTSTALRRALVAAGLLDAVEKRPTATAHILGCTTYLERRNASDGTCIRFPAWIRDALLAAVPSLEPSREDVLRSFSSRWGASGAMRQAAMRMREADPILAPALAVFASEQTSDSIQALTVSAQRMAWMQTNVMPARNLLAAALATRRDPVDVGDDLAILDGALFWLSTPVRSRCGAPEPVTAPRVAPDSRDTREYDDQHSTLLSDAEWRLVETGYAFNHMGGRDEDADIVDAILSPLARRMRPGEDVDAQGQPMRATRMRGRLLVGTISELGDMTIASAHRADRVGDRLSVQTEVAAYVLLDADGREIEREGPETTAAWLVEMLSAERGGAATEPEAVDG
jgi:hypothetical protein